MALTFGGDPKFNAEEKEKARKLRQFRRAASGVSLKKKLIKEKARKAERYKRRAKDRAKGRTTTRKKG
jgi:hypothetical protein